jgi:hypothetical protein
MIVFKMLYQSGTLILPLQGPLQHLEYRVKLVKLLYKQMAPGQVEWEMMRMKMIYWKRIMLRWMRMMSSHKRRRSQ